MPRGPSASEAPTVTAGVTRIDSLASSSTHADTVPPLPPLAAGERIAGRYVVESLLGRGGHGEVYRVHDRAQDRDLALKLYRLGEANRPALQALEGEFALLASLSHPNLATVHDFGRVAEGVAYLTQSLATGAPLDALDLRLDAPATVRLIAQLCRALDYLHARGVLHRDVKPSNVLVDLSREHLTLLDFGVARAFGALEERLVVGTYAYLAPEAITGGPVDARADLYALGVTLYKLATGKVPFRGPTHDILAGHLLETPPPIPDDAAPPAVRHVVERLLAKEPGARPASASEVLAELTAATGVEVATDTAQTLASFVLSARFVGHDDAVTDLTSRAIAGAPRPPVLIVGEAGTGKSRLLREVRQRAQLAGRGWVAVDANRAVGRTSLVQEIARLVLTPGVAVRLTEDERIELARAVPELRRRGERLALPVDPERARRDRLRALARAIEMSFGDRPGVLAIEDLHWVPREMVGQLVALLRMIRTSGARCQVLVTARPSDAAEQIAALGAEHIACGALAPPESARLVESMFGDATLLDGTALGAALAEGPHPAQWICESLRLALEQGTIARRSGRWRIDGDLAVRPLAQVLRARIRQLATRSQDVVLATAVLRRPATLAEVAAVCGRSVSEVAPDLTDAVRSGLVEDRRGARGRTLYAMHDRAVDVALQTFPPNRRRRAHARAAAREIEHGKDDPGALASAADHLVRAGDVDEALQVLEHAIDAADRAGRPDLGVGLSDTRLRLLERRGGAAVPALLRQHDLAAKAGLGSVQQRALAALGAVRRGATSAERVEIALRLASDAVRAGDRVRARRLCRRALSAARHQRDRPLVCRLVALEAEIEGQFGRVDRAFDLYQDATRLAARLGDRGLEAGTSLGAALLAMRAGQVDRARVAAERATRAARALGDRTLHSEALRQLGNTVRERGAYGEALRLYRRAVREARASGSSDREAMALNNLAILAQFSGRVSEALDAYRRAIDLKQRMGATLSILISRTNRGALLIGIGRYDEAQRELGEVLASHHEDSLATLNARGNLADVLAVTGRLDEAIEAYRACQSAAGVRAAADPLQHTLAGLVRALVMRGERGDLAEARRALVKLERACRQRETAEAVQHLHSCRAMVRDRENRLGEALADSRVARAAGGTRHFWGVFGTPLECRWIEAVLLARLGRRAASRRAAARTRDLLDRLAKLLPTEDARRVWLQGHPVHRAIAAGRLDTLPGWSW